MSRYDVRCQEQEHLPALLRLRVNAGERFDLLLLQDPATVRSPLRRLVLRPVYGDPSAVAAQPVQAPEDLGRRVRVLRCMVEERPSLGFRVVEHSETFPVESREGEQAFRLGTDDVITPGQSLVVGAGAQGDLRFALSAELGTNRGLNAGVGGSDWRRSPAQDLVVYPGWITPDVKATLDGPVKAAKAKLAALAKAASAYRTSAYLVLPYAVFLVSGGVLYSMSTRDEKAAEARAEALQVQLDAANQALAAVTSTAQTCEDDRGDLALRLNDKTEAAQAAASKALDLGATEERVGLSGAAWAKLPALVALDAKLQATTTDAVAAQILDADAPLDLDDIQPCLDQTEATAGSAPEYLLLWSPDEDLLCPDSFTGSIQGVPRAGRWALSARVARDFGPALMDPVGDDPLDELANDRWSSYALANGERALREAILNAEVRGRPPVAPSQADLWALALLDAYSQLPSQASGANDETGAACVSRLMTQVDQATAAPELGAPVLPDLLSVAGGAALPGVQPDAGCPWVSGGFQAGAKRALLAVARQGRVPPPAKGG